MSDIYQTIYLYPYTNFKLRGDITFEYTKFMNYSTKFDSFFL